MSEAGGVDVTARYPGGWGSAVFAHNLCGIISLRVFSAMGIGVAILRLELSFSFAAVGYD